MTETQPQTFGTEVVKAVNEFHDKRDEIRGKLSSEFAEGIPSYVSDETRRQLITEARAAEEQELKERTRERIEATLNAYPDKAMGRREELHSELVKKPLTNASAETLMRLSMNFEDDLENMARVALDAGNAELTGLLFAEATSRNLPELQQQIAVEAGGVYEEYLQLPQSREDALAKVEQQRLLVSRHLG